MQSTVARDSIPLPFYFVAVSGSLRSQIETWVGAVVSLDRCEQSRLDDFDTSLSSAQPVAEGGEHRLRVVADAVEAAIDQALDATAKGLKSAAATSVEAATPTGDENGSTRVASETIPT